MQNHFHVTIDVTTLKQMGHLKGGATDTEATGVQYVNKPRTMIRTSPAQTRPEAHAHVIGCYDSKSELFCLRP